MLMSEKSGVSIIGRKPYDLEDDFADSISRGIRNGVALRKQRELEETQAKKSKSKS